MRAERYEECNREIGVEVKILAQLWKAQVFGAFVCAAAPKRRFGPMLDLQRGINCLFGNISRGVVFYDLCVLQFPRLVCGMISRSRSEIVFDNVVVRVLL